MSHVKRKLEKLRKFQKHKNVPLLYKIHREHQISKRTLFYVKEYGPNTNVPRTIIRESIKILLFASIISAFGGFAVEQIKALFISIVPLVILLPALNDMIGDYGTIISSKFSTMLHESRVRSNWQHNERLQKLFTQVVIIALIATIFSFSVAIFMAHLSGYEFAAEIAYKVFVIAIVDVLALVSVLFITSVIAGLYIYKKGEDPNNFLIPITTSVADFGNMIILALLVIAFF